jgi:hypothetical protein
MKSRFANLTSKADAGFNGRAVQRLLSEQTSGKDFRGEDERGKGD